jgi:hypothetical protein
MTRSLAQYRYFIDKLAFLLQIYFCAWTLRHGNVRRKRGKGSDVLNFGVRWNASYSCCFIPVERTTMRLIDWIRGPAGRRKCEVMSRLVDSCCLQYYLSRAEPHIVLPRLWHWGSLVNFKPSPYLQTTFLRCILILFPVNAQNTQKVFVSSVSPKTF